MTTARVISIHRYPVKSMAGETLARVALARGGVPGDRAWAVRDERRGGIRGAKQLPGLMQCRARYLADPPETGSGPAEITLQDGTRVSTSDPGAGERISASIGHPVTLWPLRPADDLDHYRRAPMEGDIEAGLRAVFGRTPDEPLPDLARFPKDLFLYESPPGTYFDAYPLLLVTQASLRRMQRLAPGSAFDVRRFRPNLVVETGGDDDGAFPELAWRGQKLRVGGAVLRVTIECPRCVMVTHPQAELPKDPAVMRALVREAGGVLGVYAEVEEPGPVAVGDGVRAL
jgi:hypothetical protein